MENEKLKIALVTLNPEGNHNTSLYLLKTFAFQDPDIANNVSIELIFFDSQIPNHSNAIECCLAKIMQVESDMIGFSCSCWNIKETLMLIDLIKLLAPEKMILLGGPEVSGKPVDFMQEHKNIDFIIKGEGELAFQRLLQYLLNKLPRIEDVNNLIYKKDNQVFSNAEIFIDDLSIIPPIFTSNIIDLNKFGENVLSFETKRDCQYNCFYCFHHRGSHAVREFPIEQVKRELDVLLASNIKYIWIVDPCFNANEERSIEIIQHIVKNNHNNIVFGFELRNETLTEHFIEEMSKLKSLKFVALGMQTITQKALEAVNRTFNRELFEQNIKLIKKYFDNDTRIHIDIIYGLPFDTLNGYKESIEYCYSLGAVVFSQPLKILPGAVLENLVEEYGIKHNPHPPYDLLCHNTFSYQDLKQAKKIHTALNFYQANKTTKDCFDQVKEQTGKKITDILEDFGSYLWDSQQYTYFENYWLFSNNHLLDTIEKTFFNLYGISPETPNNTSWQDIVKIDWATNAKETLYK